MNHTPSTKRRADDASLFEYLSCGDRIEQRRNTFQPELYPMVRWTFPWLIGIVAGCSFPLLSLWLLWSIGGGLLGVTFHFYRSRSQSFGVSLFLLLFLGGLGAAQLQQRRLHPDWDPEKQCYTATVLEPPVLKTRSCQLSVETDQHHRLALYLAKDSLRRAPQPGDRLCFYAQPMLPNDSLAAGEFDFATYLLSHGYAGTAYVRSYEWQKLSGRTPLTLQQRALKVRDRLLSTYRRLGFGAESLAVLSALTLGDKSSLPVETKELFSVTGVGHVLALSGLHVGILYGLFLFLFSFLPKGRFTSLLQCLLPIAFLWSFAYITGLSVSVVRSVVMFTLLALQHLLHRKSPSINALAFSAFVTTLHNPYVVYDLGFQLSYTSVAAILLFHPFVDRIWEPSHRVVRYLWSIFSLSLLVQMAIAPLLLRAFGHYSVYFLLGNFFALPMTFLLVAGALWMLMLGVIPFLQQFVADGLQLLLKFFIDGLQYLSLLPHAYMKVMTPSMFSILLFYAALLVGLLYLYRLRAKQLYLALTLALLSVGAQCYTFIHPSPAYLLFRPSARGTTVVGAAVGEPPVYLTSVDSLGLVTFGGKRILSVKNRRWNRFEASSPLPVDYLLLSDRYQGTLSDLQRLFRIRQVLIAPSDEAAQENVRRLYEECEVKHLAVKVIDTPTKFMLDE